MFAVEGKFRFISSVHCVFSPSWMRSCEILIHNKSVERVERVEQVERAVEQLCEMRKGKIREQEPRSATDNLKVLAHVNWMLTRLGEWVI